MSGSSLNPTANILRQLMEVVAAADPYTTQLSPEEEAQFQVWKMQYAPHDSGIDYDLRGAFKAGVVPDPDTGHMTDQFKKPNHPTFSDQSKYAKDAPDVAGHWVGEGPNAQYVPGPGRKKKPTP